MHVRAAGTTACPVFAEFGGCGQLIESMKTRRKIAVSELVTVLCDLGIQEQSAQKLVSSVSRRNGFVDYVQFVSWMFEPSPRKYDACLFDFDGTIAQSEDLHRQTFAEALGVELSVSLWNKECVGHTPHYIIEKYRKHKDLRSADEIVKIRSQLFSKAIDRGDLVATSGIHYLMEALSMKGIHIGVVTSGDRFYIAKALKVLGLASHVNFLLCGNDDAMQGRVKPHPFPYLHAAAELGVDPSRCLVVEDSCSGIRSGQSAGMPVVVIASPVNEQYEKSPSAEGVVARIQDFNSFPEHLFGTV